jgi:hypothetical protein
VVVMIGDQQLMPGLVKVAPRQQRLVPASRMIHGVP